MPPGKQYLQRNLSVRVLRRGTFGNPASGGGLTVEELAASAEESARLIRQIDEEH